MVEFAPSVTDEVDEPLPGLAERFAALADQGLDDEVIAERLRAGALESGVPLPVGRGLSDVVTWLKERLRRRELVADLGEHPIAVPVFSFHVPPHGAGELSFQHESTDSRQFTIKLLGTGLGSGRKIGFSLQESFPERRTCARFVQHVTARSRLYALGGGELETVTDVIRRQYRAVVSWADCPYCGVTPESIDVVDFELADDGVDHRNDEVGEERVEKLTIETESSTEVGARLEHAGASVDAGLTAKVTARLTCTARWVYPAGYLVVPYRPALAPGTPPFWAVA
jgi:hypothetical protein